MDTATRYMSETFDNVLSLQKIEDGGFELRMRDFHITDVLRKVHATAQYSLQSREMSMQINVDESMPMLVGDSFQIAHVIVNFISNAIKFSPVGSSITVTASGDPVNIDRTNDWWLLRVEVEDHGMGLSGLELTNIFKPYVQLHSQSHSTRGTGIGLSLCREIIQLHGGKVFCRSTRSAGGSVFGFELPLQVVRLNLHNEQNDLSVSEPCQRLPQRDLPMYCRDDDNAYFLVVDGELCDPTALATLSAAYFVVLLRCSFESENASASS